MTKTKTARKTAETLATEAAECIESCNLRGAELRLYLKAFVCEAAAVGDLDAMRSEAADADREYERELMRPRDPEGTRPR